jgi:predicted ATPase
MLADITFSLEPVNVLVGPNGSGKSSILGAIWFPRGCAAQGADATAAERDHGIGLPWDGAADGAQVELGLSTADARRIARSDRVMLHHTTMEEDAAFRRQ